MKRISNILLFIISLSAYSSVVAEQSRVDRLISHLSHERYVVREAASRDLIKEGINVVPDLIKACPNSDAETNYRALLVLERIGLEGDPEDLMFVVQGLELLSRAGHPELLARSKKLSGQYEEYKSQVALKELRRLGAHVQEFDASNGYLPAFDVGARGVVIIDGRVVVTDGEPLTKEEKKPDPKKSKKGKPEIGEAEFNQAIEKLRQEIKNKRTQQEDKQSSFQFGNHVFCVLVQDAIVLDEPFFSPLIDAPFAAPLDIGIDVPLRQVSGKSRIVTIDKNWKGGTEGFKLLNQIKNLYQLRIVGVDLTPEVFDAVSAVESLGALYVSGSSFAPKDMFAYVAAHPNTNVTVVGKAMLGVYPVDPTAGTDGCTLSRVAEESGAAKAGLQANDTIIEVDGHKVTNFATLTYTVAGRDVDQVLKVKVRRDGKVKDFEVKLGKRADIEP